MQFASQFRAAFAQGCINILFIYLFICWGGSCVSAANNIIVDKVGSASRPEEKVATEGGNMKVWNDRGIFKKLVHRFGQGLSFPLSCPHQQIGEWGSL